jgi:hypothetical protein
VIPHMYLIPHTPYLIPVIPQTLRHSSRDQQSARNEHAV